jgi:hypothetical protein
VRVCSFPRTASINGSSTRYKCRLRFVRIIVFGVDMTLRQCLDEGGGGDDVTKVSQDTAVL